MLSKLWQPIQEHINGINLSMPAVHHYTSVRGALGIMGSGRIWFTERAHLNDSSEISLGIRFTQATLLERGMRCDASRFSIALSEYFAIFGSSARALVSRAAMFHNGRNTLIVEKGWFFHSKPVLSTIQKHLSIC